jgi:hypothetical protein
MKRGALSRLITFALVVSGIAVHAAAPVPSWNDSTCSPVGMPLKLILQVRSDPALRLDKSFVN